MVIKKTYEKFSVRDFFLYWFVMFTIALFMQFIAYVLLGRSIRDNLITFGIIPFLLPVLYSLMWSFHIRNGIMSITEINDMDKILTVIGHALDKWGYKEKIKAHNLIVYDKKTIWGRFWNSIFREGLELNFDGEQIILKGKRNTFMQLEYKLKKI
jgi:hypothetical protein